MATTFYTFPTSKYSSSFCTYSFVGCSCEGCGISFTDDEECVVSYNDAWYCCSECLYECIYEEEPIDEAVLDAALDEDYDW